jgi:hypothetical protein
MLGGMVSLCSLAICLRTLSELQEAITTNAAMPLIACEHIWTPLGASRVVFGLGHLVNTPCIDAAHAPRPAKPPPQQR